MKLTTLRLLTFLTAGGLVCLQAEEPFSFDATPGELPKDVVPSRYEIVIEPSIEQAEFHGSEVIELDVRRPARRLVLNSLGLEITRAVLHAGEDSILKPKVDATTQTIAMELGDELPAGKCTLSLDFRGKLNERTEGLFITRYQAGGEARRALMTQMEATDARRMFPCWDEPVFRARFGLSVIVPAKLAAISNMPVVSERPQAEDRKRVTFADTPAMASYLVALCVGEFEELRDEVDGVALRVVTTAGKREQGRYAIEATKKILPFYNEYFGVKYPLPKLDQIAFATAGASGMENWGCIIYADTALLFDPAASSQSTQERVFSVVAHEIAHQWFGDLVTMAWWDNLWLNEGFASWMAAKAADRFNPEWQFKVRAAAGACESAMALDSRATTHPIRQRVVTEAQAHDAFDEITYQKGQSFLFMLEGWLGEDKFRAGLRAYMQRHAYSSTTTENLWTALEEASGKPVRAMAAGWTEQPGFPVVKVELAESEAGAVRLTQERFSVERERPAPLTWQIPLSMRLPSPAGGAKREILLGAEPSTVRLGPAANLPVVFNADAVGYFRVAYPELMFASLRENAAQLSEADRLGLVNDTWALVQAGMLAPDRYLDLAEKLAHDASATVAEQLVGTFRFFESIERGQPGAEKFKASARSFLAPQFARLGWDGKPGEPAVETHLRSSLAGALGALDDPAVVAEARQRFAKFLEQPASLDGNLRVVVLAIVGRHADDATYERIHTLARAADSFEQKSAFYGAMAAARDPALARKTLALALADELPPREATRLVSRVAHEGAAPELAWEFAQEHLDHLLGTLTLHGANDFVPGIFRAFDDDARADELEAFAKRKLSPAAVRVVARAADEVRFKARLKSALLPALDAWCASHDAP